MSGEVCALTKPLTRTVPGVPAMSQFGRDVSRLMTVIGTSWVVRDDARRAVFGGASQTKPCGEDAALRVHLELRGATAISNVAALASLTTLGLLALEGFRSIEDLSPLGNLRALTDLELGGAWMTPRNPTCQWRCGSRTKLRYDSSSPSIESHWTGSRSAGTGSSHM
jgi:hypothetical protein